jgi:surface carbohydrate biosynthesis protein
VRNATTRLPRAALVVDSPKRDLAGAVLVAHELVKLGIEPYLVPMYLQGYDVPLIAPDAILVNYARLTNKALLEAYRSLGIRVLVMDTEGGVLSEHGVDSPDNWSKFFVARGLQAHVDRYLFWGSRVHDAFAHAHVLPPERLQVTGCPRYDFCSEPWRALLDYPERGFVLVNTNFSAINPLFTRSIDDELEVFTRTGWPREYTLALFEELGKVFPRYLDEIAGLATRNPQRRIIVRPHPFESAEPYRRRYAGMPNVAVDGAGNVLNALAAADCMVHLNCGSAVETLLLGKTPIALEYLNTERMRSHASLPSAISCAATGAEDLDALVNSAGARAARWDAGAVKQRYIEPWFHVIDGHASARTAAAVATEIGAEPHGVRVSVRHAASGGVARPSRGQRAQGLATQVLGSRAVSAMRARLDRARHQKGIDAAEVARLFSRVAECDAAAPRVRVTAATHPYTGARLASLRVALEPAR